MPDWASIRRFIGNLGRLPEASREMRRCAVRENARSAATREEAMEAATRTEWSGQATDGAVLESFNPATGERVGAVPKLEPGDVQAIVDDVAEVQPFWAQLPLADRARYMRRAAQVVIDNLEDLTSLLSREQGKPRSEAYTMALLPTIDALHWIEKDGP